MPQSQTAPSPVEPPSAVPAARLARRAEFPLLVATVALVTVLAFVFFYLDVDITRLRTYGYLGLFIVTVVGAATVVLPSPSLAAVLGAGVILDPVLGVPAFLVTGLVAGLGEALGELTGYALGFGGSPALQERPFYPRLERWMARRGSLAMFLVSVVPNPLFDVAGVAAGVVRMPPWKFFVSVWLGKTVKDVLLAGGAVLGLGIAERYAQ